MIKSATNNTQFALVLSGGGAKGAWEAGFLKYVAEKWGQKFSVVCGSSIGAMNGMLYCAAAHDEKNLSKMIVDPWNKISFTKAVGIPFRDYIKGNICSLLDNSPLIDFINQNLDTQQYRSNMDKGIVGSHIVTTTNLNSRKSYVWVDTTNNKNYDAITHTVKKVKLTATHIVASGAIPVAFKPTKIDGNWHSDGSATNNTPILPAIMSFYNDENGQTSPNNLDRKAKILVITQPDPDVASRVWEKCPNIIVSTSHLTDAMFANHMLQDISKANIINSFLDTMGVKSYGKYRKIELLVARPTKSVDSLATTAAADMGLGFLPDNLTSSAAFIFIVQPYIQRLLKLGYDDAVSMHSQLDEFFKE